MAPLGSLTTSMGFKLGPIMLSTLITHFLNRELATKDSKAREELLYDEAFTIVKSFMEASTKHTVEELQAFSNTRIPAPPWVRTVRVMIPLSSCDKAADKLIEALGGKEMAKKTVGGTRWWQVRGLEGIPAEWIVVRKDIAAQRKRNKTEKQKAPHLHRAKSTGWFGLNEHEDKQQEPHEYTAEMEGTPCMLYVHGGGGYFGSIDQQRYTLHRYARKMNGRVFAINYRLAPQYPFPCAIHDALSAYLYLLEPPEGAKHGPVDPSSIILAGDSAGGNIVLALLQVIRDTGLPAPAGAVLISPWCDLTHSFPSCMTNAASDIIPPYGLSLHKPSPLWPPPSCIETTVSREHFVSRLKQVVHRGLNPDDSDGETITIAEGNSRRAAAALPHETTLLGDKISKRQVMVSSSENHPEPDTFDSQPNSHGLRNRVEPGENATLLVDGKAVTIRSQIQFYAMNEQLTHPLVSPAMAYLGGLPPCLFLASDKELLRDEIIYTAHKAAHPDRYPVKEETRKVYPAMEGIESRYGPTDAHLQVYDETCHVLPLYSFTTPAKYCYRAIATFCKFITASERHQTPTVAQEPERIPETITEAPESKQEGSSTLLDRRKTMATGKTNRRQSLLRRLTLPAALRRNSMILKEESMNASPLSEGMPSPVTTPIHGDPPSTARGTMFNAHHLDEIGTAGHPAVYECEKGGTPFINHMIRERVKTNGEIRALEDESSIPACTMKLEDIGVLHEESVRRYLKGQAIWERKFAKVARTIEGRRQKHINLSTKDGRHTMDKIRKQLHLVGEKQPPAVAAEPDRTADEHHSVDLDSVMEKTVLGSRQWKWGWALEGESPPPSSIVARGDTGEARRLGQFADRQLGPGDEEHSMSGNNLWSVVVEALTRGKPPGHRGGSGHLAPPIQKERAGAANGGEADGSAGYFSWFRSGRRQSDPTGPNSSSSSSPLSSSSESHV